MRRLLWLAALSGCEDFHTAGLFALYDDTCRNGWVDYTNESTTSVDFESTVMPYEGDHAIEVSFLQPTALFQIRQTTTTDDSCNAGGTAKPFDPSESGHDRLSFVIRAPGISTGDLFIQTSPDGNTYYPPDGKRLSSDWCAWQSADWVRCDAMLAGIVPAASTFDRVAWSSGAGATSIGPVYLDAIMFQRGP